MAEAEAAADVQRRDAQLGDQKLVHEGGGARAGDLLVEGNHHRQIHL